MSAIIDCILRLKDSFTPNLTRVRQQLTETQRTAVKASAEIKRMGSTISGIGQAMMPVATGITAGIGYAAKQFADFSYSIMRTAHIAGASAEELHQLEDVAINVGSKLPMTINETSKAMAKLAAGGFNTQMIKGTIEAIGMAAEASGADIGLVSDVMTNAMSIWDMKSGDIAANSSRVADVIQAACNKSKMSYDKFAIALQGGGNVAASFGESIERVTALMGVFANNGIGASNIGTTLKNAYMRLAADTDGAADKLAKLGVRVFDDNGKMRSMVDIVTELSGAVKNMSDADLSPILKKVFGMYALPGLSKVLKSDDAIKELNKLVKDMENATATTVRLQENVGGSADKLKALGVEALNSKGKLRPMIDIVKELHERIKGMDFKQGQGLMKSLFGDAASDDVTRKMLSTSATEADLKGIADKFQSFKGKSEAAFDAMQATFGGKIKLMMSTFDAFVHKIGKALEPLLTPLIDGVTQLIKRFMQLDNVTLTTILKISMGFVAMTGAILTLGASLTVFGKLVGFLAPIGAQLATATSFTALLAPKLAALSTGFSVLKNVALMSLNAMLSPLRSLGTFLLIPFARLAKATTIMTVLAGNGTAAMAALKTGLTSLALSFGLVGANGVTIFGRIGAAITGFAQTAILGFAKFLSFILLSPGLIAGAIGRIITTIRMIGSLQGLFTLITYGIRSMSMALVASPIGAALLAIGAITLLVAANWQTFKAVAENVWNKIKFAVTDVVDSLKTSFNGFSSSISKSFDEIITCWNRLTGSSITSSEAMSAIINTLGSAITAAVIVIATSIEGIVKAIMIVVETIAGVLSGIIQFITGVFTGNWSAAWEGIKNIFMSIFGGVVRFFENFIDTISSGIDRLMGRTTQAAQEARDLAAAEVTANERNTTAAGAAISRRRAADAAENASLDRSGGGVVVAELDTSKVQSGLDNVGEASKVNADAILNNAQTTQQINQNLSSTSQSIDQVNQQFTQTAQALPQSTEAVKQSMQAVNDNVSGINMALDTNKTALQQHSEISTASKDAIQQLGEIANTAKEFIKQLGDTSLAAFESVRSLGDNALTAATSLLNIDGAIQTVIVAMQNAAAAISNIQITAPVVTIPAVAAASAETTTPSSENVGHNFTGTNFWRGGKTWVHEQGPELIDLPSGTRIVPHSRSLQEEYQRGFDNAMSQSPISMLPFAFKNGTVSNSQSKIREVENFNNPTSKIDREFVSNADRNVKSFEGTGNAQSNFQKEYSSNVQSDINEAADTGNKSSLFSKETVKNPTSDIDLLTVNNAQTNINREYVNNPQIDHRTDTVNNAQSDIAREYVNNAQSDIAREYVNNAQSNIDREYVNNAQSNINREYVNNPQSNIDREYVNNAQSNIDREYVNNAQSDINREYVNNPQIDHRTDTVKNPSSIFNNSTVNNPTSDIKNETVSNPQSDIDLATVKNPSSIFSNDTVKNPATKISNDVVNNADSHILQAEKTGSADSNIRSESNSQPSSDIQNAESTGNPSTNQRSAEDTGNPSSNNHSSEATGNPQTNIYQASTSNAQSNIHANNQGQNVYAPNLNLTIAKIADTVVVREESDIAKITDRVVNKMVFWFQAHANNRIVGAVR